MTNLTEDDIHKQLERQVFIPGLEVPGKIDIIKVGAKKSISDVIFPEELSADYPILISAPTGKGKSTFITQTLAKYADDNGKTILFISSRVAINVQQKKSLAKFIGEVELLDELIGNIRLDKLKPHHLMEFYDNLKEPGIRVGEGKAIIKVNFPILIQNHRLTREKLAQLAGVAPTTITAIGKGRTISEKSAIAVAKALEEPVNKIFILTPNDKPLSDKTVLHHHRLISSILQSAVEWQVIYDNPASRVKPPKVSCKEANCLQDTEAIAVLKALESEPIKWKTAIILLMYSGIRRGELFGLEWKDFDFENCLISIRRTSQYVKGMGIIEKGTKNYYSERVMKLDPTVFHTLQEYTKAFAAVL